MADLDIGSILSSLSSEDINNLKNMANSILGGNNNNNENPEPAREKQTQNNTSAPFPDFSSLGLPDMSQFSALLPLLSQLNSHDDREDFIYALKPLLSKERQRKADESIKFIKLLSIIPLLKEKGLM